MLAYVFWHWRRSEIDPTTYEQAQRRFHAALAAAPPAGFSRSTSSRLASAPWAAGGSDAYEDWYLVQSVAALDALNQAAVSASRAAPHDAAAALAQGGTAGLYVPRGGALLDAPRSAAWFSKPAGMSYATLDATLRDVIAARRATLWMRYMVLGPTPEFCLQTVEPVQLPAPFSATTIALRPIH